jgi:tRNA pseudouridine55 synthase
VDGVLVIDKPSGITSHDVVAVVRRTLRERRVGHTGTLDPMATGVLPLALGRATRLARFFSASDKDYDATIRFGLTTDTYDVTGTETGRSDRTPAHEAVERALESLRGEYLQPPPAYSAKRVGGKRAYDLARREEAVVLAPAPVRVSRAELRSLEGGVALVAMTCSTGFYVRSFAHTLGELTGAGACLQALRRTRSGAFGLDRAVTMDELVRLGQPSYVTFDDLLPEFPAAIVNSEGRQRVVHGRELEPAQMSRQPVHRRADRLERSEADPPKVWTRVLDEDGHLIALATAFEGRTSLHPSIVLI